MPHFKIERLPTVKLTAGQRTTLGNLLQSIYPGISLANVRDVAFARDGAGGVDCFGPIVRTPVSALADLNDGDTVERT